MGIFEEIDAALWSETRKLNFSPREAQLLIVLSTEGRNEFMRDIAENRTPTPRQNGLMGEKYRGAVLAVTHDEEMPRVSVFARRI